MQTISSPSEQFLSRAQLAKRWSCSNETIKRRTAAGILKPLRFNQRFLRYRLSDVVRIEDEAAATKRSARDD